MARGINKVFLLGNLGRDPETGQTKGGTEFAKFSVATAEYGGKDKEDHTEWHRCVAFGKTAEIAGKYLSKGKQVHIEGRNRTSKYEVDGESKPRYSTEVIVDRLTLLGGKDGGGAGSGSGGQAAQGTSMNADDYSDDIPF